MNTLQAEPFLTDICFTKDKEKRDEKGSARRISDAWRARLCVTGIPHTARISTVEVIVRVAKRDN